MSVPPSASLARSRTRPWPIYREAISSGANSKETSQFQGQLESQHCTEYSERRLLLQGKPGSLPIRMSPGAGVRFGWLVEDRTPWMRLLGHPAQGGAGCCFMLLQRTWSPTRVVRVLHLLLSDRHGILPQCGRSCHQHHLLKGGRDEHRPRGTAKGRPTRSPSHTTSLTRGKGRKPVHLQNVDHANLHSKTQRPASWDMGLLGRFPATIFFRRPPTTATPTILVRTNSGQDP